jgi:hypothetical protein
MIVFKAFDESHGLWFTDHDGMINEFLDNVIVISRNTHRNLGKKGKNLK